MRETDRHNERGDEGKEKRVQVVRRPIIVFLCLWTQKTDSSYSEAKWKLPPAAYTGPVYSLYIYRIADLPSLSHDTFVNTNLTVVRLFYRNKAYSLTVQLHCVFVVGLSMEQGLSRHRAVVSVTDSLRHYSLSRLDLIFRKTIITKCSIQKQHICGLLL